MILQGLDALADHPQFAAVTERCDIVPVTKEDDEQRWLEIRRAGLGGSDVGAALGLSPYMKPIKLWLIKTGQIPDDDLSDKEAIYWGNRLEHIVAEDFATKTGYTVIAPRATFVRRDRPAQRANPDYLYLTPPSDEAPDGDLGILECKTGDWRTSEHWDKDTAPAWYEAQGGWYCDTLGIARSRIAALLGGNRFIIRDPAWTLELAAQLGKAGMDWWDRHVVAGVEPPVDGSKATTDALNAMWDKVAGQMVLTADDIDLVRRYATARAAEKDAAETKQLIGNQLRHLLADYEEGVLVADDDRDPLVLFRNRVVNGESIDWQAVAADLAAVLGINDPLDAVRPEHRTPRSYRRLDISRSKAALAILQPPA